MKWEIETRGTVYVEAETEAEATFKVQSGEGHRGAQDVVGVWPMSEKDWQECEER